MKRRQFVATLSGLTAAIVVAPFVVGGSEKKQEGHASLLFGNSGWWLRPLDDRKLHVGDHVYVDLQSVTYNRPGLPGVKAATFRVWDISPTRKEYRIMPIEHVYWVRTRQVKVERKVKYQVVQTAYAEAIEANLFPHPNYGYMIGPGRRRKGGV